MAQSEVAVIVTVLNEAGSIRQLIEAFFSQTFTPSEIIVVDGGSADGTQEILREYAAQYPQCRLLVEAGVNIARGRNLAIQAAKSPIIAVTDGGCRPDRCWLGELVAPLLTDASFDAVAGRIVPEPRSRFEKFAGLLCLPGESEDPLTRRFYGRSSAFRKAVWQEIGGYPEWLYTAEDTLFALRFNELGKKVAFAGESHLYWYPRPSLWKLGKMFFLYGVGQGRINVGSVAGSIYWLRYHFLWMFCFLVGLVWPWACVISAGVLGFLYYILVTPSLARIRRQVHDVWREVYVPVIVIVRSIATNVGFLVGKWQYERTPTYREKLMTYRGGVEQS